MSAILPPEQRIWWKQPLDKVEGTWILIAFAWCLVMFFMMPYWHVYGKQNLSAETYKTTAEAYGKKVEAFAAQFKVREETAENIPVVHPPAGSDIYLLGRLWAWWPILELENGKTYRLHLSAMDYQHGFSLQPENINIQVLPGYEHVVTITPNRAGSYSIVCNEFCGIGHHKMVAKLYVKYGGDR